MISGWIDQFGVWYANTPDIRVAINLNSVVSEREATPPPFVNVNLHVRRPTRSASPFLVVLSDIAETYGVRLSMAPKKLRVNPLSESVCRKKIKKILAFYLVL